MELDHSGPVTDCAFSPDNQYLAVADANRLVTLYGLPGYEVITLKRKGTGTSICQTFTDQAIVFTVALVCIDNESVKSLLLADPSISPSIWSHPIDFYWLVRGVTSQSLVISLGWGTKKGRRIWKSWTLVSICLDLLSLDGFFALILLVNSIFLFVTGG